MLFQEVTIFLLEEIRRRDIGEKDREGEEINNGMSPIMTVLQQRMENGVENDQ